MPSSYNTPAWQQPTGDFSAANIYALRHGETPMNAARNGNLGLHYGQEAPGEDQAPLNALHLIVRHVLLLESFPAPEEEQPLHLLLAQLLELRRRARTRQHP
ncbi:hypothetical protein O988_09904 [Pseudogymnoascus sp. VKM F-3808]|nr:hypothetical protein O988_09904 [Pseudogymnoascus sp. VKM F-3808]